MMSMSAERSGGGMRLVLMMFYKDDRAPRQ